MQTNNPSAPALKKPTKQPIKLTPAQVVLNATPCIVTMRDGSAAELKVRQLDIEGLYLYIDAMKSRQVPQVVARCIGQDLAFVNNLDAPSYAKLAGLVFEQNFMAAMAVIEADPIAASNAQEFLVASAMIAVHAQNFPTSSLEPASSASAEATSTASSDSPSGA